MAKHKALPELVRRAFAEFRDLVAPETSLWQVKHGLGLLTARLLQRKGWSVPEGAQGLRIEETTLYLYFTQGRITTQEAKRLAYQLQQVFTPREIEAALTSVEFYDAQTMRLYPVEVQRQMNRFEQNEKFRQKLRGFLRDAAGPNSDSHPTPTDNRGNLR